MPMRLSMPDDGVLVDANLDGHLEVLSGAEGGEEAGVASFEDPDGPSFSLSIANPGCKC